MIINPINKVTNIRTFIKASCEGIKDSKNDISEPISSSPDSL